MTIEIAMLGRQISAYNRVDRIGIMQAIGNYVIDLAMSLNVSNNLDSKQVAHITDRIKRHYWHLKLAEIALFIDQAKSGQFGKSYNRLDEGVFFEWLDKYCDERNLFCETEQNKAPLAESLNINFWDKRVLEVVKQIGDEHSHKSGSIREKLTDPEFRERYRNEFLQQQKTEGE